MSLLESCIAPDCRLGTGRVLEARRLAPSIVVQRYELPGVAERARPGQFLHVRIGDGTAPLLRRPFSILDADPATGTCRILFKVVGTGTRLLALWREGDAVDALGPLGSAFAVPAGVRSIVMVAGGIGMVPLHFLAKEIAASREGVVIDYWFGSRSVDEIYLLEDLAAWCRRVEPVTDDGSIGRKGRVTGFAAEGGWRDADMIVACGPTPMLAALQRLAAPWDVPVFAAMENFMGCGLGACLGCVVDTDKGYERVCTEGPVFELKRLKLA